MVARASAPTPAPRPRRGAAAPLVRAVYPWLADGHGAETARAQFDEFTIWDGRRGATPELDPRASGAPQSASRIQILAQCPFRYFLKHVLRIEPPDDLERDTDAWLEPRDGGKPPARGLPTSSSSGLTRRGEKPDARAPRRTDRRTSPPSDRGLARKDAAGRASSPSRQRREEILLAVPHVPARRGGALRRACTPRWFEVPFGLPRPTARAAIASRGPRRDRRRGGSLVSLRGTIDRVDEAADGTFHVWDYKTGSPYAITEANAALHGGRQVQPALYAMALEDLLARAGQPGRVSPSGYFFPGGSGEGQRMPIRARRRARRATPSSRLLDLLRAGVFPHATSKDDCRSATTSPSAAAPKVSRRRSQDEARRRALPGARRVPGDP